MSPSGREGEREAPPHGRFLRSAGVVSGFTLASRVLGLCRDAATAHLLGDAWVNDALTYAWTLPNAFRRLFGEGALSAAFLPVFTGVLEREGLARARIVARQVISTMGVFLVVLAGVLVLLAGLLSPEWIADLCDLEGADQGALTIELMRWLLPYLAVICVIAQFMGVLNAVGEFAVPAISPLILNVVWIAGVGMAAVLASGDGPAQARIIAIAILAASVLQFAWHLPRMAAKGVSFRPVLPRRTPELIAVLGVLGPMLLGMGAGQVNIIIDRTVAMAMLPEGGTTHVYYGLRLMQFPMGLISVALGTAVYPALARLGMAKDTTGMARTTALALRANLLLTLPAAAGLMLLAGPIVSLFFEHGGFGSSASSLTSQALLGYAAGVPAAGTMLLLTRASYALGDSRTPMRIALVAMPLNAVLDLALVGPFGELGLAAATSITFLVTSVALAWILRRRLGLGAHERLLGGVGRVLVATACMAAVVAATDSALLGSVPAGRWGMGLRVAAGVGLGVVVYGLLAARLCRAEWSALRGPPRAG